MTTIKATCPYCGTVELTTDDVKLVVCVKASWAYYQFRCPSCIEDIRKTADDQIISLLVCGGVKVTPFIIPAEALEPHTGPVITNNDILEFGLSADSRDYLADYASSELSIK